MGWRYFPVEVFREMGEIGLMGMLVPEEYGGAGLDMLSIRKQLLRSLKYVVL